MNVEFIILTIHHFLFFSKNAKMQNVAMPNYKGTYGRIN
jgi:hypothetical protein